MNSKKYLYAISASYAQFAFWFKKLKDAYPDWDIKYVGCNAGTVEKLQQIHPDPNYARVVLVGTPEDRYNYYPKVVDYIRHAGLVGINSELAES